MRLLLNFLQSTLLCLLRLACPILLLLIGLVKIGQRVNIASWQKWFTSTMDLLPPWTFLAFWIALPVLVLLLAIVELIRLFQGKDILILNTTSGFPLRIRKSAVARFVHDRLESLAFIRRSKIEAKSVRRALEISGKVWVSCSERVDNFHNQICDKIVEETMRALGVTKVLTPKIVFEDLEASLIAVENREQSSDGGDFAEPEHPVSPSPVSPLASDEEEPSRPAPWKFSFGGKKKDAEKDTEPEEDKSGDV